MHEFLPSFPSSSISLICRLRGTPAWHVGLTATQELSVAFSSSLQGRGRLEGLEGARRHQNTLENWHFSFFRNFSFLVFCSSIKFDLFFFFLLTSFTCLYGIFFSLPLYFCFIFVISPRTRKRRNKWHAQIGARCSSEGLVHHECFPSWRRDIRTTMTLARYLSSAQPPILPLLSIRRCSHPSPLVCGSRTLFAKK